MSNSIDDTVKAILRELPAEIAAVVVQRWDSLTKPRGSLGRLETEVTKLAQIQGTTMPKIERKGLYVFCGDHGITEEGVSLYPSVVTREMVKNFAAGGAAINVLCRQMSIETCIVDAGVKGPKIDGTLDRRIAEGTGNFRREAAMSPQQATRALEEGIALAENAAHRFDIVGVGEMGIGNSTSASALLCVFAGVEPEEASGRGAGLDQAGVRHKSEVIAAALHDRAVDKMDPLSVVAALGGFEIAMMAGFFLGAAAQRLPVVVDGFISGSAFLTAQAFSESLSRHCFFAHRSAERGHARLLTHVGAEPLLDLALCLGEGTGAALAIALLDSGVQLYRQMATFADAAVSDIGLR